MSIITSVPYPNFIDGVTVASGAQVNANFSSIISQVNANAAQNGANSDITSLSTLASPPSGAGSLVFNGGTAGGTANAIVIAATYPTGFPYVSGNILSFIASAPPTGATTLEVSSQTEAVTKWINGTLVALTGGEWATGEVVVVQWDGTEFQLISPYQPTVPGAYVGEVRTFAFSSPPALWLPCEGQSVSRTTYVKLFTAIGTTFGVGDGSTTFELPPLNGYFIRGYDFGGSVDPGRTFGSSQADTFTDHGHDYSGPAGPYFALPGSTNIASLGPITQETGGAVSPNGGGTETRPKNVAMLFAIYAGI